MPVLVGCADLRPGMRLAEAFLFRGRTMLPGAKVLTTEDIEATEAHLKAVGITPTSALRKDHRGVDGNRGMWITDPNGNRIEIMEMAPNCIQFEAIKNFHAGKPPHSLKLYPGQKTA